MQPGLVPPTDSIAVASHHYFGKSFAVGAEEELQALGEVALTATHPTGYVRAISMRQSTSSEAFLRICSIHSAEVPLWHHVVLLSGLHYVKVSDGARQQAELIDAASQDSVPKASVRLFD
ncbi:hypothetical protein CPLU01_04199 [Colletotrichum plurivorum]|uniref:Uncharacterized protein n=1 Tax=Colletotrichum plurivorum TaxID=2175906 RepID=A0A8H6NJJ3_9PEZI|nr:hypothetical protein CPLU01_04199 [Colletotrichum plurivorum]